MLKQFIVIPALAAFLACIPGKALFAQKIVLSVEGKGLYVVDIGNNCSVQKMPLTLRHIRWIFLLQLTK